MFDSSNGFSDADFNKQLQERVSRLEAQVAELRVATGLAAEDEGAEAGRVRPIDAKTSRPEQEAASPPPIEESPAAPPSTSIEKWFEDRGFTVEIAEDSPVDQVFDRIAEYLGDHFSDLERLLRGLRWSLRDGRPGRLTPRDNERDSCLDLCRILHDRALLSDLHFNRTNGNLSYKASGDQRFQQFLDGYWLERYVLGKARRQIEAKTSNFSVARNLELKGAAGRFEMDVFLLVEGSPIWIECKSRSYQQHIDRYVKRGEALGVPLDKTILVVQSFETQDAEGVANDLRAMFGLSVTPTSEFSRHLEEVLTQILDTDSDGDELTTKLANCFKEGQMSPHPEVREEILSALVTLPADAFPLTVRDIRERVREKLPEDKQPFVHPVLMALRRGGGMISTNGRPYTAMRLDAEIASLPADDLAGFEALCRVGYEETLKRKLPKLVELPEFPEAFERLVNGRTTQPGAVA